MRFPRYTRKLPKHAVKYLVVTRIVSNVPKKLEFIAMKHNILPNLYQQYTAVT